MPKTEEQKQQEQPPVEQQLEQQQGEVKVITLLALLSDEQQRALFGRFNRTWDKAYGDKVKTVQKEYGFDYNTAAYFVSMQLDADGLLSNERVKDITENILRQTRGMFGSDATKKESLRQVSALYDTLSGFEQKAAGKVVRTRLFKDNNRTDANRILDTLLAELKVNESEWS